MEVLRGNFKELLPQITASVKKADFLAIDAEFTGLMNGRDVSMFDTPSEYYKCLLYGATDFLVLQFGVCAFYWDVEKKHYMNDTFNFYLFPRTKPGPDVIFSCQSSSIDFLVSQKFDFNKVLSQGISYMAEPVETKLRQQLIERQKSMTQKDLILIPDEQKAFVEETIKKVRNFLSDGKSDVLLIDKCNAFVRMLLYQELKRNFKEEIILETVVQNNGNRLLKILRTTSENQEKLHTQNRIEKELEEFEDAVGFSKVARMISQSEKLVVGHNMLLDMVHTLNLFFQPLPDDYQAFKEFTHCMFPNLLDTKYMSSLPPFKDKVSSSVLGHLLGTLSEPPFSIPTVESLPGKGYQLAQDKQHEAGFDSFITGICFLSMHDHLVRMRGEEHVRVSPSSPMLKPFLNKFFLARTAHQDSPCMNLTGPDPVPARDHVFHISFPKDWGRSEISALFTPYGSISALVFLDDMSAIVALNRRNQAHAALRGLSGNHCIKLMPYGAYKAMTEIKFVPNPSKTYDVGEKLKRTCAKTKSNEAQNHAGATKQASGSQIPQKVPRVRTGSDSVALTHAPAEPAEPPATRWPRASTSPRGASTSPRGGSNGPTTRKRTSSVFMIEEIEAPPKKAEKNRANSDGALQSKAATNGRRKNLETSDEEVKEKKGKEKKVKKDKSKVKDIELKVIDTFDSESKSKCVTAFKESDSWD